VAPKTEEGETMAVPGKPLAQRASEFVKAAAPAAGVPAAREGAKRRG
jgi:hypothetical protein